MRIQLLIPRDALVLSKKFSIRVLCYLIIVGSRSSSIDSRRNHEDVWKMLKYLSRPISLVILNSPSSSSMSLLIISIYMPLYRIDLDVIYLMTSIISVGKSLLSSFQIRIRWISSLDMQLRINMKTLLNHLFSIYFTIQLLLIEVYLVILSDRSIYSLQIMYFLVDIFRELISQLDEFHPMYGILPRYHIHYKNTCILSKTLYNLFNSSIEKKERQYYIPHNPFLFFIFRHHNILSTFSREEYSIEKVVRMFPTCTYCSFFSVFTRHILF